MTLRGSALHHRDKVVACILDEITFVMAEQACHLLRRDVGDPAAVMQAIIERRTVIALPQDGVSVFPAFQFDAGGGRVADVSRVS